MTTRSFFQALHDLMLPEVLHQGLILEEKDARSRCPPIRLNRRGFAVVLRPDQLLHTCDRPDCHARAAMNARLFPFFSPYREGVTSLCDFLLFYEPREEKGPTVFLVELKSGSGGGAHHQIRNGKLLAEYLLRMTSLHGQPHTAPHVAFRGLVFTPDAQRLRSVAKGPRFSFDPDSRFSDLRIARLPADQPWDLDAMCAS